jgi:hypothetical protein
LLYPKGNSAFGIGENDFRRTSYRWKQDVPANHIGGTAADLRPR